MIDSYILWFSIIELLNLVKRYVMLQSMKQFMHPSREDITLSGLLGALADPVRLQILISLMEKRGCMSCTEASPHPDMAKSTLSHHFRILREAGLIRTVKQGVENRNCVRQEEIDARFPGLLEMLVCLAQKNRDAL